jgi:hypothetical protein
MARGPWAVIGIIAEVAGAYYEEELIEQGLEEAIETMESMIGNEGQQSVLETYIIPEFELKASRIKAPNDWPGVDPYPYQDFMGEIVEAGNQIMDDAYQEAAIADQIGDWGDQQNRGRGLGGILDFLEDVGEGATEVSGRDCLWC